MDLTGVFTAIGQPADGQPDDCERTTLPWEDPVFSARFAERVDYPTLFGHPPAAAQIQVLERQLGLQRPSVVLDLCSGPGTHAIELARRRHRVVAVDVGPGAVQLGQARAAQEGVRVQFVAGDVLDGAALVGAAVGREGGGGADAAFVIRGQVDNFTPAAVTRLAHNLAEWVRPGGRVGLEFTEPAMVAKEPTRGWHVSDAATSVWADHNCLVLAERRWDAQAEALLAVWLVLHPDGRLERYRSSTQTYRRSAIGAILADAGFTAIRFEPGDDRWTRLVATRSGGGDASGASTIDRLYGAQG